ncbi:hypothetical protein, partial [Bradyrhizobium sp. STM 3809]|uniref:hypothetical protein n=1 Tax=Bradyrhizobium sp. STM 3809 TaxID=551936 RepID=UPI001AEC5C28
GEGEKISITRAEMSRGPGRVFDATVVTKPSDVIARLDRAIQYAAAHRFNHCGLWNTGSPGQAGR